jgi:hypothetical protein
MFHRNISILFRLAVIICFLAVLTSAYAGEGKPIAVIEADTYDFGEVYEGTDIIANFIVKNTGDADLEILTVKTKK